MQAIYSTLLLMSFHLMQFCFSCYFLFEINVTDIALNAEKRFTAYREKSRDTRFVNYFLKKQF